MIPLRIRVVAAAALALAAVSGCRDAAPKPPRMGDVFQNLPLPPGASMVSKSGGADAIQITFRSPYSTKRVVNYYREVLSKNGWRLVNQAKAAEGATVLYAEQDGPPLWVTVRPAEDSTASFVDLAGALVSRRNTGGAAKPAS
jgi:hypothetical protein